MSLALAAQRLMAMGLSWQLANMITGNGGAPNGLSIQLGTGEFLIESVADNLVAKASGNQGNATPLTAEVNRVITVGTAADSVALPASVVGLTIFVINHGANSMQVFGAGTDTVDDFDPLAHVGHADHGRLRISNQAPAGQHRP